MVSVTARKRPKAQISRRQRTVCALLDSAYTEDLKLRREEEKMRRETTSLAYIQEGYHVVDGRKSGDVRHSFHKI